MVKTNSLLLDEKFEIVAGYLYGFCSPSLIISINKPITSLENDASKRILDGLSSIIPISIKKIGNAKNILDVLKLCIFEMQTLANWPIFEETITIEEDGKFTLIIPVVKYAHQSQWVAIQNLIEYINTSIALGNIVSPLNKLSNAISFMKNFGVQRENVLHFLKAAFKQEIPFIKFPGTVYQFGYGALSQLLDSSFTEASSYISTYLAKDKGITLEILNDAGIPTPNHARINHPNDAMKFANTFGLPVVIKPGDTEGGIGVTLDIRNENEAAVAFNKALKFSKHVVVENYITGHDYRLVVFQGKLIWAIHRVPAHVLGDGTSSISALIAIENKKSSRNTASLSPMKPLELNEESIKVLQEQGFDQNSVLQKNAVAYLKKQGSISTGGTPVAVFDKVHEDNRMLAIRAAEALRLDLAGIDLLMPDITKSWREVGGAICEVNAQPMLGSLTSSHLYALILDQLILKKGRPPTSLILNLGDENNFAETLTKNLNKLKIKSCLITKDFITNHLFSIQKNISKELATTRDMNIDAYAMVIHDEADIKNGLAFQYIDNLIVIGNEDEFKKVWESQFLGKILPMCDRNLLFTFKINDQDKSKLSFNKKIKITDQLTEEQCLNYVLTNIQEKMMSANDYKIS